MSRWPFTVIAAAAIAMSAASADAGAAPSIASTPWLPMYGQPVSIELRNSDLPTYLPATRYTRSGPNIVIDYEYLNDGSFMRGPDFGQMAVPMGELAPGNYNVQARLIDIHSKAAPIVISGSIAVMPPEGWGIYTVPVEPLGFAPSEVVIRSAAYFDPRTMRASVAGNVIRVDFDYQAEAPTNGQFPAGMSTFGAVRIPGLAPGNYVIEGWGRPNKGGATPTRYFTRNVAVSSAIPVVEFYNETLDHYFMSAGADEIQLLDNGGHGGWKRTGQSFKGWARAADAPPNAVPVCRFYARGPNSHFYTGDPAECQYLKTLETQQRADAQAKRQEFIGWGFEMIALYALLPHNGQCPAGMSPVYRSYNNRWAQNDQNHRFTAEPRLRAAMMMGWVDEGVAFCSLA